MNRVRSLNKLSRKEEALVAFHQVFQRFNESEDLSPRESIMTALVEKGEILRVGKKKRSLIGLVNKLQEQVTKVQILKRGLLVNEFSMAKTFSLCKVIFTTFLYIKIKSHVM